MHVKNAVQMTAGANKTVERMQQAAQKLRAAIALCPGRRDAYGMLAQMEILWDPGAAISSYAKAESLSMLHDELWAKSAVTVFEHLYLPCLRAAAATGVQLTPPTWLAPLAA